jgi:hypothetical protein
VVSKSLFTQARSLPLSRSHWPAVFTLTSPAKASVTAALTCRGAWVRVTIDQFRHSALQNFKKHRASSDIFSTDQAGQRVVVPVEVRRVGLPVAGPARGPRLSRRPPPPAPIQ